MPDGRISQFESRDVIRSDGIIVAPPCHMSNNVFPAPTLRKKFAPRRVDSPPSRSTHKWSGTAQPATRNIQAAARSKLLYKSSGPDTVSAQHSRRTPCVS
jgi:hypothetical protein